MVASRLTQYRAILELIHDELASDFGVQEARCQVAGTATARRQAPSAGTAAAERQDSGHKNLFDQSQEILAVERFQQEAIGPRIQGRLFNVTRNKNDFG